MAFQAIISSINYTGDQYNVLVQFKDTASGWSCSKGYTFPSNTTQAQAVAQITDDGTVYKTNLTASTALQSKVGTVITI